VSLALTQTSNFISDYKLSSLTKMLFWRLRIRVCLAA